MTLIFPKRISDKHVATVGVALSPGTFLTFQCCTQEPTCISAAHFLCATLKEEACNTERSGEVLTSVEKVTANINLIEMSANLET